MLMTAAVTAEDKWFVARCLRLRSARQGHSVEEALANLREALELYLEDHEHPEPVGHPIVAPLEISLPAAAA